MKKYVIILLFVLFITCGCTSAAQKEIQQQYVEVNDSIIVATQVYINFYLSIIEKHHFYLVNNKSLSEQDTVVLKEKMYIQHEKIDSLEKISYNLRHIISISLLRFYFWSSFTFYNASVKNMQVEFYARLMNARIKLNEDAFYSLYVKSHSQYNVSINKKIKKRKMWMKTLGLKSELNSLN